MLAPVNHLAGLRAACLAVAALLPLAVVAQADSGWQACATQTESASRLACFDRWAESQRAPAASAQTQAAATAVPAPLASQTPAVPASALTIMTGPWRDLRQSSPQGCHDAGLTALSRFWELEASADCGKFEIRGYRPITLAVVAANSVNRQPTSGNPDNNAATAVDYRTTELRLQLSLRTKVATGLLPWVRAGASDSLWLAYTQQSYWQLFSPRLSRPFRSTDHEPELIYVLPLQSAGTSSSGWRLRHAALGIVHQSNGQSLPYSRSWNRAYLMAGAEYGPYQLQARLWRRLPEGGGDDNPGIGSNIGRAELRGQWQAGRDHLLAATVRHSLDQPGRGSLRLEWFRSLGDAATSPVGGLQLHTQLFTGWGDSLLDFNRRRTVFSVGLSLVEW
jgi:phospholipase A1